MRFIALLIFLLSLNISGAYAQSSSDSASVQQKDKDLIDKLKQIEIFKEKIATKVAEVRLSDKAVLAGELKSVSGNLINLQTTLGEKTFTFSEDTLVFKIEDGLKKEAKKDDLKIGSTLSAFGNLNENKDTFLAKFIYLENQPVRLTGIITDINKSAFTFSVKNKEGDLIIDYEKYSKITVYDKVKGSQKSGFSKLKIGETVFIMAQKNPNENNRYSALRIINLPLTQISLSPASSPAPTSAGKS